MWGGSFGWIALLRWRSHAEVGEVTVVAVAYAEPLFLKRWVAEVRYFGVLVAAIAVEGRSGKLVQKPQPCGTLYVEIHVKVGRFYCENPWEIDAETESGNISLAKAESENGLLGHVPAGAWNRGHLTNCLCFGGSIHIVGLKFPCRPF